MRAPNKVKFPPLEDCSITLQKMVSEHKEAFQERTQAERADAEERIFEQYCSEVPPGFSKCYEAVLAGIIGEDTDNYHHIGYRRLVRNLGELAPKFWVLVEEQGRSLSDLNRMHAWINKLTRCGISKEEAVDIVLQLCDKHQYNEKHIKQEINDFQLKTTTQRLHQNMDDKGRAQNVRSTTTADCKKLATQARQAVEEWMSTYAKEILPEDEIQGLIEEFGKYLQQEILGAFRSRVNTRKNRPKGVLYTGPNKDCVLKAFEALDLHPPESKTELDWIQIRTRYRRLSFENHPDRGGDHEKFLALTEAYDVLKELKHELNGVML